MAKKKRGHGHWKHHREKKENGVQVPTKGSSVKRSYKSPSLSEETKKRLLSERRELRELELSRGSKEEDFKVYHFQGGGLRKYRRVKRKKPTMRCKKKNYGKESSTARQERGRRKSILAGGSEAERGTVIERGKAAKFAKYNHVSPPKQPKKFAEVVHSQRRVRTGIWVEKKGDEQHLKGKKKVRQTLFGEEGKRDFPDLTEKGVVPSTIQSSEKGSNSVAA